MADIHIDDFYHDVAKIFLRLYSTFPVKITLYVEDISGPDEPDEFGLHHPRFEACFSTMVWLAQQGYLSFESAVRQEALDQVVLTQKSFLLLTSHSSLQVVSPPATQEWPPSVEEEVQTNISQLRGAVKEKSSILVKRCVSYLLAQPAVGGHQ